MKKILKALTSTALAMTMVAGTGVTLGTSAMSVSAASTQAAETDDLNKVTIDGNYLYNGFIKVSVDPATGQFTFGTTGGNPDVDTDDDKMLLYGFPNSIWSSYTTIAVDGTYKKYHSLEKTEVPTFSEVAKQNSSTGVFDKLTVSQTLSFVRNVSTNRDDVLEVRYVVTNEDTVAHNVGVRIMFDTKLGSNDHAPFRVAGYGDVTTETVFEGSNIPQYWQAFDSLENPLIVSQGSFLRDGDAVNNPDKVQFCNFWHLYDNMWEYQASEGSDNGDSAVGITWYEKALAPGESRSYSTYYGMSELTQNTEPPLSLSVYSDSIVTAKSVNSKTGEPVYNEMTVTGYVQNIGDETTHNTYAKLVLPRNMTILNGSAVNTIGTLDAGKIKQITWIVRANGNINPGEYSFKVLAGCDETTEKSVERKVTIPEILRNKTTVKKAHLTVGDRISITAAAEGGYGSYLYAMYYKKTADSGWTKLQDYGTNTTATVKTDAAVPYQVMVKVKDENGSIADKTIDVNVYKKLTNKSTAPKTVNLGNKVTMKGAASGGSGSYKYAYYYKRSTASKYTTLKTYSTTKSASFTPKAAVNYSLKVIVKDTKTGKTASKILKVTVKDPLVNTSTVSAAEVETGKPVTVAASAKGGKAPYQFAVFTRKDGAKNWKTQQELGRNTTVALTFDEAGKYEICVHAKDAEGTLEKKFLTVDVYAPLENLSTIDTKSLVSGNTARITAAAKNGAGDYTYSVYYKKSTATKWTAKQKGSTNTAVTFTPTGTGKYQVRVKAIDKAGNVKSKTFTVTVAAKLKNTSTLSADTITLGKKVTVNASATGGKGSYQFAVYYKKTADKDWTLVQKYNASKTVDITPKTAGTYQVCVRVKDGRGTVVEKKYLDLTVKQALKNTSTVTVGTKVTLKGSATGANGTVSYAFYYKRTSSKKWITKQNFRANAKVTIAAKSGVSYDYCIKVKDGDGTVKKKYFTIKIG